MHFEIVSKIDNINIIATGKGIKELHRLVKSYGGQNWRKMKGTASIRLFSGKVVKAEIHWYECHGVGRKEFKIKKYI